MVGDSLVGLSIPASNSLPQARSTSDCRGTVCGTGALYSRNGGGRDCAFRSCIHSAATGRRRKRLKARPRVHWREHARGLRLRQGLLLRVRLRRETHKGRDDHFMH